jgi:hypothetical protein
LLSDPPDLDAFGRALTDLLASPQQMAAMGRRARGRIRSRFLSDRHLVVCAPDWNADNLLKSSGREFGLQVLTKGYLEWREAPSWMSGHPRTPLPARECRFRRWFGATEETWPGNSRIRSSESGVSLPKESGLPSGGCGQRLVRGQIGDGHEIIVEVCETVHTLDEGGSVATCLTT